MTGSTYANALFDELRRLLQACTTECEERMPSAEREKHAEDAEGGTREGKAQAAGTPPFCVSGRSVGTTHKPFCLNGSAHRWQKENQRMQRGVISETGEGGNEQAITALGPLCRQPSAVHERMKQASLRDAKLPRCAGSREEKG